MEAFGRFLDILDELRVKCPWDRKQTNESLRPNTIEETYELCDALMRDDKKDICKELGDVLATGYWASRISEITEKDTVLIIGAGPTGICTLLCVMLKKPKRIIVCEKDENRVRFIKEHYPDVYTVLPEECLEYVQKNSDHGGADVVLEVAGAPSTFRLAWECARPNAIVTVVALYDEAQTLPLPDMYGKNLTFKTGGVDGCDCEETLRLIAEGKIDTEPLITHTYPLSRIEDAYELFENKKDGVIKVAVEC